MGPAGRAGHLHHPGPVNLTVLYDEACPVCRRARRWVEGQRTYVPVDFVPAGSDEARCRFPALDHAATRREITVVGDDGATYRDEAAWIVVLWAVASTRQIANDVAMGRKRRLFGGLKGATEWVRRLSARRPTPAVPGRPRVRGRCGDRAAAPGGAHPLGDHRRRPDAVPRAGLRGDDDAGDRRAGRRLGRQRLLLLRLQGAPDPGLL